MHILGLELENVKSYEQASIAFTEGVNAIVGQNGAGKSTILEAIGFVLFDAMQYNQREFLREGTRSGRASVTFLSNFDDRVYRVERRFGGSNSHIVFDDELGMKICEGKADVMQFVREHAQAEPGTDLSRLFTDALGVPQGTLTAAFLLPPAQRKSTFDPLLQVDEYRNAVDRLREPRRLLQEAQQLNAVRIADLTARLERLPDLELAAERREQEIAVVEETLQELQSRLDHVVKQRETLESIEKTIGQLVVIAASKERELDGLAQQKSEIAQALQEARTALEIVTRLQAGHDRYLLAQDKRRTLEQKQRIRQELLARRAVIDKSIALAATEYERLQAELAGIVEAEVTLDELANALQEQASLEQALATAEQDARRFAELDRQIAGQERNGIELRQREQKARAGLALAEETQQRLTDLQAEATALQAQIDAARGEQVTVQAATETLKKQNSELADASTAVCPICEQPLNEMRRTNILARNEERLTALQTAFGDAQRRVNESGQALKNKLTEQEALRRKLLALPRASELEDLVDTLTRLDAELESLKQERIVVGAGQGQVETIRTQLELLGNPRERSALAAQAAERRAETEERLADAEADRALARGQLADVDAELANFVGLDEQLLAVDGDLAQHQEAYQTVLEHIQQAQSVAIRQEQFERVCARLEEAQAALSQHQAELAALEHKFDRQVYISILSQEQSLRGEFGGLTARLAMLRHDRDRDHAEIVVLHQKADELAALQQNQQKLSVQESVLESVRSLLRQAGPHITQALISQVSSGAAHIFGELMHDFSRHLRWNEDYGIVLEVDGSERAFVQLSGGEQMSAALAVRLALVREMSSINIAFFDEPTANLDDARREALAQQIMNVKGFGQIFVISHDDTFEQVTQNLIRVNRNGNTSTVAGT